MHQGRGVISSRGCWRCGRVDKSDRELCGDGRLSRPRREGWTPDKGKIDSTK